MRTSLRLACLSLLLLNASGCTYGIVAATLTNRDSDGKSKGAQPSVDAVSPSMAGNLGGDVILVSGERFAANSTVSIGGIQASEVVFRNPGELEVTVPPSSTIGLVDVVVTSPKGGSGTLAGGFEYTVTTPPSLTFVQPSSDAFDVALNYTVSDAVGDTVRITDVTFLDLTIPGQAPETISVGGAKLALPIHVPGPQTKAGVAGTIVWDSATDLGPGNNRLVQIAFAVENSGVMRTFTSAPFFVSNGPLGNAVGLSVAGVVESLTVGDVTGDGRPEILTFGTSVIVDSTQSGAVDVFVNQGLKFDAPERTTTPVVPGAFTYVPPPFPASANTFLLPASHPSSGATLDVDNDATTDLVVLSSLHASETLVDPFHEERHKVLEFAAADAPDAYAHVIAHQQSLRVLQVGGSLDFGGAAWESTQVDRASGRAPHTFHPTQIPLVLPGGTPELDRIGWFGQEVFAADLDGPGQPGAGSQDLVTVQAVSQLGRALAELPAGPAVTEGVVVIRQVDPGSGALGAGVYLDPTDMGVNPIMAEVADIAGAARASAAYTAAPFNATAPVGSPDIVVANRGDSSITFYMQTEAATWPAPGAPTFASYKYATTAHNAQTFPGDLAGVAAGDLDGDGANDLVAVGEFSQTLTLFLHDPDAAATDSLAGASNGLVPLRVAAILSIPSGQPQRPVVADVSGDGLADIILPTESLRDMLVYVSQGLVDGVPSFAPTRYSLPHALYPGHQSIAADVNGDRLLDVVTRNGPASIAVQCQITPGTLDEAFTPIVAGTDPGRMDVGDVTGDGQPNLVVPNAADNTVYVYRRGGAALELHASVDLTQPSGPQPSLPSQVSVSDIDGDGLNDIVVNLGRIQEGAAFEGGWLAIWGNPLGTSVASIHTGLGDGPTGHAAVGDLNEDGLPDVVTADLASTQLTVFTGAGAGNFTTAALTGVPVPLTARITDVDGDGHLDVLSASVFGFVVFYNGGHPAGSLPYGTLPSSPVVIPTGLPSPGGIESPGDLDGNGLPDLVAYDALAAKGAVIFQTAARAFTTATIQTGTSPGQIATGDLNRDGFTDVAIPWGADGVVAVYYRNPTPTGLDDVLEAPVLYRTSPSPLGAAIFDVDNDGANDLVVSSLGARSLNVFLQR